MALLSLTVNNPAVAMDKQHGETHLIARALDRARLDICGAGGAKTSGNIIGDGGVVLGTWTYTPQASN
jgi:hypothetical protein